MLKIRDIMQRDVQAIADTACIGDAYTAMNARKVRHLPVVHDGAVVGMLSERDVLAARIDHPDWWLLPVERAMTSPAKVAAPGDSVAAIGARLRDDRIGAMPVVDDGALVGIVSVIDVLEPRAPAAPAAPPAVARDAMTPFPIAIHPDAPLGDAIREMTTRAIRHLPVVDRGGTLVGILSEGDVRTAIGEPARFRELHLDAAGHLVADALGHHPAVAVPFDAALPDLARRFAEERLEAVAVQDRFGALIGIVSYIDLLRALTA